MKNVLEAFLNSHSLSPCRTAHHDPALMVKVAEDDEQALVLFSENVTSWHFHVVERDVGGASSRRVGCLDGLGLDARTPLNEEYSKTLLGLACDGEVIAEVSIGDPSKSKQYVY